MSARGIHITGLMLTAAAMTGVSSCATRETRTVGQVLAKADSLSGDTVLVAGAATAAGGAWLVGGNAYRVSDRSGTIVVMSDSAPPCLGSIVEVRGVVAAIDVLDVGLVRLGPVLREVRRKRRASSACAEAPLRR